VRGSLHTPRSRRGPHPKFERCSNFDLSPQAGRGGPYRGSISPRFSGIRSRLCEGRRLVPSLAHFRGRDERSSLLEGGVRGTLHTPNSRRSPLTRNSSIARISTSPRKRGEVNRAVNPIQSQRAKSVSVRVLAAQSVRVFHPNCPHRIKSGRPIFGMGAMNRYVKAHPEVLKPDTPNMDRLSMLILAFRDEWPCK